jgi:CRISPR-associated protein Cas2
MRRLWVVSYDMACDWRRARLAQWLLGEGDRVLESVFECAWPADRMPAVRQQLSALIDPKVDRVRLVPVCAASREASIADGQKRDRQHICVWVV